VRFPIDDFRAIMELSSRINIDYIKNVTTNLLRQVVSVPDEKTGGYSQFQLFKECEVNQDDNDKWYVEINAHDKTLPLMFEFKNKYFTYQLFNTLRLKSSNQLRMYELLKQYENSGSKIWPVKELKKDLWIGIDEYPRFGDFKSYVLNVCQQALKEYTDIKFTYAPHGKKGKSGKILNLKFTIEANQDYTDQITLDMFIKKQRFSNNKNIIKVNKNTNFNYKDRIDFLKGSCNDEFSFTEIEILNNKIREFMTFDQFSDQIYCHHYINDRYKIMINKANKGEIKKSRFGYVKSLMNIKI